jgi:hypothetical protein
MAAIAASFATQAMSFLGSALPVEDTWSVARANCSPARARFNLRRA